MECCGSEYLDFFIFFPSDQEGPQVDVLKEIRGW